MQILDQPVNNPLAQSEWNRNRLDSLSGQGLRRVGVGAQGGTGRRTWMMRRLSTNLGWRHGGAWAHWPLAWAHGRRGGDQQATYPRLRAG